MSDTFKEYEGALKYAFTTACGGKPGDWEQQGVEKKDRRGKTYCHFFNSQTGQKLRVTDQGMQEDMGGRVFDVKGKKLNMSMTVPDSWKNLKV